MNSDFLKRAASQTELKLRVNNSLLSRNGTIQKAPLYKQAACGSLDNVNAC